jgi:hypothetical protein
MEQVRHTPTPWRVEAGQYGAASTAIVADELPNEQHPYTLTDRWHIAHCVERNPYSRAERQQPERLTAEANAAHIVRCVNAHEQLVRLLRSANAMSHTKLWQDEVRAALAAAGGV